MKERPIKNQEIDIRKELFAAFSDSWAKIGAKSDAQPYFDQLATLYSESHRHYHTLLHIYEMVSLIKLHSHMFENSDLAIIAAFYHDAIYDIPALLLDEERRSNEDRSAALAISVLQQAEVTSQLIHLLTLEIIASKHNHIPEHPDAQAFADIDMSILAAPWPRFLDYENGIYHENSQFGQKLYRKGRSDFLNKVLEEDTIFHRPEFKILWDSTARQNINAPIEQLQSA